jgi:APA family basic amino acid/polyamine antiporter
MTAARAPGTAGLIATGCGTAIACVCAVGLAQIERAVGGIWSMAAVAVAGALCLALARVFARLSSVVPSGAGLLAYLSRGLGRRWGMLLTAPYLLLTLFLVGAEATIAGTLLQRLWPALPTAVGALLFLIGTWAFCRAGLKLGFRAQVIATLALVVALAAVSLASIAGAIERHELAARMLVAAPSPGAFAAAVGQAVFLFMGFELLTSQAEHTSDARAIGRGLWGSVIALAIFYALVSAGLSCLTLKGAADGSALVPQLAIAEQTGSRAVVALTIVVCLLASFTSFNGALLALTRFTGALAAQGLVPRALAKVERSTQVPPRALAVLLALTIGFTAIVVFGRVIEPGIFAAAVAASILYAAAAWVRERPPFAAPGRATLRRRLGQGLALVLAALAPGVLLAAGDARALTLAVIAVAALAAATLARRIPATKEAR